MRRILMYPLAGHDRSSSPPKSTRAHPPSPERKPFPPLRPLRGRLHLYHLRRLVQERLNIARRRLSLSGANKNAIVAITLLTTRGVTEIPIAIHVVALSTPVIIRPVLLWGNAINPTTPFLRTISWPLYPPFGSVFLPVHLAHR